jgi:hypothetical protein
LRHRQPARAQPLRLPVLRAGVLDIVELEAQDEAEVGRDEEERAEWRDPEKPEKAGGGGELRVGDFAEGSGEGGDEAGEGVGRGGRAGTFGRCGA